MAVYDMIEEHIILPNRPTTGFNRQNLNYFVQYICHNSDRRPAVALIFVYTPKDNCFM